ncbi:preprotein translocase subunit SecG [Marinicella litoralis]|uniref:Protein-export membrane protein SecG n=1 Tax=Marinicella litoralis TaxID=644220 RepID=A0A4R6XQ33_9GAMM|nr:preprotein translocase subunit SecG [Marinicella litoralis]TDR18338.1 preprotein translocase subunit SecG [Marinicella litoralis]
MTINFLNIAQVLVAMALIGFILIQRGPGATAGSAFGGGGGGASGTVFGAKGSGSFLTKATAILATLFFIITLLIAIDAREAYSSTGEAAEQDLGVFGVLDGETQEPSLVPVDAVESIDSSLDNAIDSAGEAVDTIEDKATELTEKIEAETTDESTDSDGDNN